MTTKFERQTCTRCHGSGSYSYCQMYGTTCFGCGGGGEVYSKRGKAARRYFDDLMTIFAGDLAVGDFLRDNGKFHKVDEVVTEDRTIELNREHGHEFIGIKTRRTMRYLHRTTTVMRVTDEEHRQALLTEAFAYQDTLTKAGKPRKRKAA